MAPQISHEERWHFLAHPQPIQGKAMHRQQPSLSRSQQHKEEHARVANDQAQVLYNPILPSGFKVRMESFGEWVGRSWWLLLMITGV